MIPPVTLLLLPIQTLQLPQQLLIPIEIAIHNPIYLQSSNIPTNLHHNNNNNNRTKKRVVIVIANSNTITTPIHIMQVEVK